MPQQDQLTKSKAVAPKDTREPLVPEQVTHRAFGDITGTRQAIFDNVMGALKTKYPVSNNRYTLKLADVKYRTPKDYDYQDQKKAILRGQTLGWNAIGRWELVDNATGKVVDKTEPRLVAKVPYMTNRGTFIFNGNEYTVASQLRLRPGVYTRVKENGLIEAHFNVKGGTGPSFRLYMEPDTSIFRAQIGQASLKLYPILHAMGVEDRDLLAAWGKDILAANMAATDPRAIQRAYAKLVQRDERDEVVPVSIEKEAAVRYPKTDVNYVQYGVLQQCVYCKNFVEPNACTQVQGFISPTGWCLLWQPAFAKLAQTEDEQRARVKFVGTIVCDDSDTKKPWIYMRVHPGLAEAAWEAMEEQDIEGAQPHFDKPHITVATHDETKAFIAKYGEKKWKQACGNGRRIQFSLQNALVDLTPDGWSNMDRVWFLEVRSPQLRAFRKSLDLPELPVGSSGEHPFHITIATKPKSGRGHSTLDSSFDTTKKQTKVAFDNFMQAASLACHYLKHGYPFIKRAGYSPTEEHESMCKQCGDCCKIKIASAGQVYATDIYCGFMDKQSHKCTIYDKRFEINPLCHPITDLVAQRLLPPNCGYADEQHKSALSSVPITLPLFVGRLLDDMYKEASGYTEYMQKNRASVSITIGDGPEPVMDKLTRGPLLSKFAEVLDLSEPAADAIEDTPADVLLEQQSAAANQMKGNPGAVAMKAEVATAKQTRQSPAYKLTPEQLKALSAKMHNAGVQPPNEPEHLDDEATVKLAYMELVERAERDAVLTKQATVVEHGPKIREVFEKMELDEDTTESTLGRRIKLVTAPLLTDVTKKLIAINKGEAETDDRDSLAYQRVLGPEDLFAERIARDAGGIGRKTLWRATLKGAVKHISPGLLSPQLREIFLKSGLGSPIEEVNPLEIYDQNVRVTRLGEGGMPGLDSIPDEARNLQPSHFGLIDPIRSPESEKIGVDSRVTHKTYKGSDGKLYAELKNPKGKTVKVSAQQMANSVIAFPGELAKGGAVRAMVRGRKVEYVSPKDVDYELPHTSQMFTATSNLVPLVSAIKGGRLLMGSKMATQALPLREPEAPLVQNLSDDGTHSFEDIYGEQLGALKASGPGRVEEVARNYIKVRYPTGTVKHQIYHQFPFNRKTYIHSTPAVKAGDAVAPGQLLARSNFTDNEGRVALGKNLRTAYMAYRGYNADDAIVISESASKALSSEHMFTTHFRPEDNQEVSKKAFVSLYPGQFDKRQVETIDDRGVVKPGTVVNFGDPLILAVDKRKPQGKGMLHGRKELYSNVAETWSHSQPGVVTDVDETKDGWKVLVKAYAPMLVGDKLCYDDKTEVLTAGGWKHFSELAISDAIASLNPKTHELEYVSPDKLYRFDHKGRMYKIETQQVDLVVTENHNLYVAMRSAPNIFELRPPTFIFGKRVSYKKDANWTTGSDIAYITLPAVVVKAGQGGRGVRLLSEYKLKADCYAALLGAFISEGSIFDQPGDYGIDIHQTKPSGRAQFERFLDKNNISCTRQPDRFRFHNKQLMLHFKQFGHAHEKYLPKEVFQWSIKLQKILFDWLMWGDGHTKNNRPIAYTTTSKQLADDVQQLCLHIGYAANIKKRKPAPCPSYINGRLVRSCRDCYSVQIVTTKLTPTVNHSHVKRQKAQTEQWIDYDGPVWCCELSRNHIMYVRRNGKPVWSGNSNRFGGKGVVSTILPDDEMPRDAAGPMAVLLNPLGVVSRTNPGQLIECALGKIAAKTGTPYKVPGFMDGSYVDFVKQELQRNGLSDTDDLVDPKTGRKLSKVFNGSAYFMKLHHTAEPKLSGRDVGSYTSEGIPAGGGDEGSKRMGFGELSALFSHNATNVIRDAKVVRGQRNDDYWRALRLGYPPPSPKIPLMYEKFMGYLQGAGINLRKQGDVTHLFALTDNDVDDMSSGAITEAETLKGNTLDPIANGLFDVGKTGGHGGNRWSHITLNEPVPNPVMEEPIRRLLGLTQKQFLDVLAGKHKVNDEAGPKGMLNALSRIKVDDALTQYEALMRSATGAKRDGAIKIVGYLRTMKKMGVKPSQLMMSKVPVIPPNFRPITRMDKKQLVSDSNLLYLDLMHANQDLKELKAALGEDGVGDERVKLYEAYKAVTGLGDPVAAKTKETGARGLLKQIFGSSPKTGAYQRRMLGAAVDTTGRGVITPNPSLNMDQVGLPEDKAWVIYRPFIMRYLVRRGMGAMDAARAIEQRSEVALKGLLDEMAKRPVMITRAPVLHRYGIMAAWPVLTKGNTLQVPPIVTSGFGADFDGDAMNYHVPVSDDAVKDAVNKMLPSKNLKSIADFAVHYYPRQEFLHGLHLASSLKSGRKHIFANKEAAMMAYKRGEIDASDIVVISK